MQSSNPEIKIQWDKMARIVTDVKKRNSMIEEQVHMLEEGKNAIAEQIIENDAIKRHLKIYENSRASQSHEDLPCLRIVKGSVSNQDISSMNSPVTCMTDFVSV